MIIALSAKARHLSTAALYKGEIESKNRQTHWTIRYSYGATLVTNLDTHRANQAQHQSLSNLAGESTTAGDLPTKEGVSGTLASGRRRRLAPVRSAELLSCCCCSSFWGLASPKQPGLCTLGQITAAMNGWISCPGLCGWHDRMPSAVTGPPVGIAGCSRFCGCHVCALGVCVVY